jgi:hypothetical protein
LGNVCPIAAAAGAYPINALSILAPTAFNHNATTVLGNRGTLLPRGAVLRGFA